MQTIFLIAHKNSLTASKIGPNGTYYVIPEKVVAVSFEISELIANSKEAHAEAQRKIRKTSTTKPHT